MFDWVRERLELRSRGWIQGGGCCFHWKEGRKMETKRELKDLVPDILVRVDPPSAASDPKLYQDAARGCFTFPNRSELSPPRIKHPLRNGSNVHPHPRTTPPLQLPTPKRPPANRSLEHPPPPDARSTSAQQTTCSPHPRLDRLRRLPRRSAHLRRAVSRASTANSATCAESARSTSARTKRRAKVE